ncbi:Lipoprotein-releasing system ATP-binding protein LolD [Maioricimonas rarisocia]|uniref:Lipoprotein-releasing system ATP-binding protein LolD n=1 Tax=Maioricimonas rarisocia TaxID=2528026 RepID=A0A517ZCX7_9PLAN|nr:ABC transporter ATP-binding protein [Maioricimonas rarisocia]QDU40344.1 Lipoprotein-releasing system ATP-binding protein LolD [Maioricimonas rarisocia]
MRRPESVVTPPAFILRAPLSDDVTVNETPADLQIRQITKRFSGTAGMLDVLNGVDLDMAPGDAVAVTGPSGSGKSTLLYIVGLLDDPTTGTITITGEEPLKFDTAGQSRFRNRQIGFVFQDHHLLPQLTVLENVLIPTLPLGGADADAETRARQLLERVGLQRRVDHRPAQISGGERQRVAVCRALINQPKLLLADEPTGNLDRKTADAVGSLLLEIAAEQQTMLICVTHSLELAERFPRHYELVDGRLESR